MSANEIERRPVRPVPADSTRVLPQNWAMEQSLLGGLLQDWEQIYDVADVCNEAHFHRPSHQNLFSLMLRKAAAGGFDIQTILDVVMASPEPETYGGLGYVAGLPNHCPSVENLKFYALSVRSHAIRRGIILAGQRAITMAQDGEMEIPDLVEAAQKEILSVVEHAGTVQTAFDAGEVAAELVGQDFVKRSQMFAEGARTGKAVVTGVPTMFVDLDRKLAGLQKTDLIILGGRPAMGKTAFALNVAMNAAKDGNVAVGVFSLEMSKKQLVTRLLCGEALVDASKVRIGDLDRLHDWPCLHEAAKTLARAKILIDDTSGLTISQLRSKARRMKAECPNLGLIVVDYLQLMQGDGGPKESREQAISTISRGMKLLAKELDVPIVALSQLNRSLETRTDKRPMPSDLRESGALEQDADIILFVYRDEVYNEDSPDKGIAEIIVAKQRNGPLGTVKLAFLGQCTLFRNYADPSQVPGGYA